MKKFGIVIPTLNRADLLKGLIEDLKRSLWDRAERILIIDNGSQNLSFLPSGDPKLSIYRPVKNLGVSGSWNMGLTEMINKVDGIFLINDDIRWRPNINQLPHFLNSSVDRIYKSSKHWCNVYLPTTVIKTVGIFDENFYPAYYEDNDYTYRAKLMGITTEKNTFLDPYIYKNSQTTQKDPEINKNFNDLTLYYRQKWGGLPGEETFHSPFGEAELGGWAISEECFEEMKRVIPLGSPLLEFGSGKATPLLNHYFKVTSVEHDIHWCRKLEGKYKYLEAPITFNEFGKTYELTERQKQIISQFNYFLVDGPPSDRKGILGYDNLFINAKIIVMDDTHRAKEKDLATKLGVRYGKKERWNIITPDKRSTFLCF